MLYALPGSGGNIPTCLYPIPLSSYDPSPSKPAPSQPSTPLKEPEQPSPRSSDSKSGGGKGRKGRKKRGGGGGGRGGKENSKDGGQEDDPAFLSGSMDRMTVGGRDAIAGALGGGLQDTASLYPVWSKVSSSESEFSDTEGGQANRLKSFHCKVRQCALASLHAVFKVSTVFLSLCTY